MTRGSLLRKYAVYFIVLISSTLVLSGLFDLYFTYEENKAALLDLQREKAAGAASRIEAYVQEIERQLGWMRFPQLGGENLKQRRLDYLKLLRQVPAITDVMLVDIKGREQLRVSRVGMDQAGGSADWSEEVAFKAALGGKPYFSPVYFRRETEPYMTIAAAGTTRDVGVTVAEVNLKFIWEVITRIRIGERGLAYAVDSRGRLIAHPDISLVLQKSDLSALSQVHAALGNVSAGEARRVSISRNLQGQEVLSTHASIAPLGWHVFVEQPVAEAFAPLYESLVRTGLQLLGGLVLAVIASVYLARRMVVPIRAIEKGAAQIAAGNLDQRLEVRTGDELEALAAQFNKMAAELKESYAGLERKVEERTRELAESLAQQTATGETLEVISNSPTDLQPVFDAILDHATRLCDAHLGFLGLYDGEHCWYVAQKGGDERFAQWLLGRGRFKPTPGLAMDRMIADKRPDQIPDLKASAAYRDGNAAAITLAEVGRVRTLLAVPMLREERVVGGILLSRPEVRPFTQKQIDLVSTFAHQAAIAIENVRLFNEIQEKSRQLETANKHKSEFLASMSHELRTPLNAIIGFSEVLHQRMFGALNEKQAEYLADIHASGVHLLSLINDVLDLSKIEAGRMDLELARFDLAGTLENSLMLIHERATRRGITVTLDCPAEIGDWVADERKLRQVMLNLLSNAVKFTPEGGKITVRARRKNGYAEIAVADTGVGIKPEDQQLVFEAFRQAGRDPLKKAEGTGLGLALSRQFVELHGGTLTLESAPGKGSTFTFTLPERREGVAWA